jgi:hypothetical protein
MNEQTIAQKVEKPSVFWRAIRPWVRLAIILVGLLIGIGLWFSAWSTVGAYILLVFLHGTTTAALVLKILTVLLFLESIPVTLILIPWLFYQLVYWICRVTITASESSSLADFIFNSK